MGLDLLGSVDEVVGQEGVNQLIPDAGLHDLAHNGGQGDRPIVDRVSFTPFLNIGVTFALYLSCGTTPSCIKLLRVPLAGHPHTA